MSCRPRFLVQEQLCWTTFVSELDSAALKPHDLAAAIRLATVRFGQYLEMARQKPALGFAQSDGRSVRSYNKPR
jgi:hypothetical protein